MSQLQVPVKTEPKSHEQEIHERAAAEKAAIAATPLIPAGSFVLCTIPGSRETGGQEATVPGVVVGQDFSTRVLTIQAFHLGGLFRLTALPQNVSVLFNPEEPRAGSYDDSALVRYIGKLEERVVALEKRLAETKK